MLKRFLIAATSSFICIALNTGCAKIHGSLTSLLAPARADFSLSFSGSEIILTEGGSVQLVIMISAPQAVNVPILLTFTSQNGDEATRFHSLSDPLFIRAGETSTSVF